MLLAPTPRPAYLPSVTYLTLPHQLLVLLTTILAVSLGGCGEPDPVDDEAFHAQRLAAIALFDQGDDPEPALEALLEVHHLRPDLYGINHRIGRHYADNLLHAKALRHFEMAYSKRPDDTQTLHSVIKLKIRLGDLKGAEEAVPHLLEDPSLRGEGLYLHAQIFDRTERRDQALAALTQADDIDRESSYRALSMHGGLLAEQGDYVEAAQYFEAARQGRKDYKEAIKGLADCSRRLGQHDNAARWARILQWLLTLQDDGFIKTRKRTNERLEVLRQITAEYPEWDRGFRDLLDLQLQLGKQDDSCATLDRFVTHHGDRLTQHDLQKLRERFCP